MTKAELVEEVARAAELNKRDAEVIVETVFDSIITALHKGEKVELRGFGSFRTRERGPRRGRNPKTGEPVDVPAKRVPYFKPGKELKEYFTESPDGKEGGKQGSSAAASGTAGSESGASESGASEGAAAAPSATDMAGTAESSTAESSLPGRDAGDASGEPATGATAGGGQEAATGTETAAGTEAAAGTGEGSSGEGPTA
jgi:integration host factor subunit beta